MVTNDIREQLRTRLLDSVKRNSGNSILLSGGLDSSVVATVAPKPITAFTVTLREHGTDSYWAERVSEHLRIPWVHRVVNMDEAIEDGLPRVVRSLRSFDPGVLNDIPVEYALSEAQVRGFNNAMTGDDGDWVFAGYSFLWDKGQSLNQYLREAIPHLEFSSQIIGKHKGIRILQPYLDPQFVEFTLTIPP